MDTGFAAIGSCCDDLRVGQVRYVPGRSVTVQFTATVSSSDGTQSTQTVVASSGLKISGPTAVVEADGTEISLWRYPNDPFLPGLAAATDPRRVKMLLGDLGAPAGAVTLRRRAYRAGRRAVIEVNTPSTRLYLKVLRPKRVEAVHLAHARLAEHMPVPRSHGWSADLGIVALQALAGAPLRTRVEQGRRPLPSAKAIRRLLARMPAPSEDERLASDPLLRVEEHANFLGVVVPDLRDRLAELTQRLNEISPKPVQLVHGDFHSSQILVAEGKICGLVDIDTAGLGDPAADYASLLAHLSVLAVAARRGAKIDRYGRELVAGFDKHLDPSRLRLRVAASVLGLATGPFRVQEKQWPQRTRDRVALAEQWARSASLT